MSLVGDNHRDLAASSDAARDRNNAARPRQKPTTAAQTRSRSGQSTTRIHDDGRRPERCSQTGVSQTAALEAKRILPRRAIDKLLETGCTSRRPSQRTVGNHWQPLEDGVPPGESAFHSRFRIGEFRLCAPSPIMHRAGWRGERGGGLQERPTRGMLFSLYTESIGQVETERTAGRVEMAQKVDCLAATTDSDQYAPSSRICDARRAQHKERVRIERMPQRPRIRAHVGYETFNRSRLSNRGPASAHDICSKRTMPSAHAAAKTAALSTTLSTGKR